MNAEQVTVDFVAALNTLVTEMDAEGRNPLYRNFGFTKGAKFCRVFAEHRGGKSSRVFVGADGSVYRADSWKQRGRLVGNVADFAALSYCLGMYCARRPSSVAANDTIAPVVSAQEKYLAFVTDLEIRA